MFVLLEIESQHEHFCMGIRDALGKDALVDIGQGVDMRAVVDIGETVAELQFGHELEERQVEIATQSDLEHQVVALQLDVVLVFAREVDHRTETGNDVGTVVIEPLGRELQVYGHREIGVLHVLRGLYGTARLGGLEQVAEDEVLAAEMHRGRHTKGEVLMETQVGQHTNTETGVPHILIAEHIALFAVAVGHHDGLRPHVVELGVLHVQTYRHAKMQRAEVNIRLVLHFALLAHHRDAREGPYEEKNDSLHLYSL